MTPNEGEEEEEWTDRETDDVEGQEEPSKQPEAIEEEPRQVQIQQEAGEFQPSDEFGSVSTYTEKVGDITYKIIPEISRTGTDWKLAVYAQGTQGSAFTTYTGISDAQADELGMTRELQKRFNNALEHANEHFQVPSVLRTAERSKRSFRDLEAQMNNAS